MFQNNIHNLQMRLEQLIDILKKLKSLNLKVVIEFSINGNTESPQTKMFFSF